VAAVTPEEKVPLLTTAPVRLLVNSEACVDVLLGLLKVAVESVSDSFVGTDDAYVCGQVTANE